MWMFGRQLSGQYDSVATASWAPLITLLIMVLWLGCTSWVWVGTIHFKFYRFPNLIISIFVTWIDNLLFLSLMFCPLSLHFLKEHRSSFSPRVTTCYIVQLSSFLNYIFNIGMYSTRILDKYTFKKCWQMLKTSYFYQYLQDCYFNEWSYPFPNC